MKPIDSIVTKTNARIRKNLHGSGKIPDFIEMLHILVAGFAKMTAPSFKNHPGKLSIAVTLEMSMFFNSFRRISSVVGFNWNLVVMSKSLQIFFSKSIPYLFEGGGGFCSTVSVILTKNV